MILEKDSKKNLEIEEYQRTFITCHHGFFLKNEHVPSVFIKIALGATQQAFTLFNQLGIKLEF